MTTRTDVPLVPVPFADRTTSPLWESMTPSGFGRGVGRKLSIHDVREIRALYDDGMRQCEIAERFGVSRDIVYNVVHRNLYRDVEDIPA